MSPGVAPDIISLTASQASKITKVNIYSGRAEITRHFVFSIQQGQNQVVILGLPDSLQQDSVRVEGRGKASIHDVAISRTPVETTSSRHPTSDAWKLLDRQRQEKKKAIQSVLEARAALNTYLETVKANEVELDKFKLIVDDHEALARKFDLRILDLEGELSELTVQAGIEKMKMTETPQQQTWQVGVNLWAESIEKVEIYIQYVVLNADWSASYDIRADTESQGKNITILYKAVIRQNTGESWEGIPLTLETTNPAFGLSSPQLPPWNVGIFNPSPSSLPIPGIPAMMPFMPPPVVIQQRSRSSSRSRSPRRRRDVSRSRSRSPSPRLYQPPVMSHVQIGSSNKGNIAATFEVPGFINIPSDGLKHSVTISKLTYDATLLWYSIPKVDAKIYIKAKIKNESEYRFIPGPANVYVDGSFVATSAVPGVSPEETFDCPLGLDPSISVTYHPREKKATQTGFVKKSSSTTYIQRITLLNAKSTPIANLKVVDSIPVSQDERIEIKLISPSLPVPTVDLPVRKDSMSAEDGDSGSSLKAKIGSNKTQKIMRVLLPSKNANGVVAQWDGIGDPDVDQQTVGKNGRVSWIVTMAPQEKVTLALKYEISFPEKATVFGL
ncbi:hypothetical protein BDN70DRAFT_886320 [Pholiota conissans]|uniref:Mucoidy inhibitor A n=1 Tax=Pholiota conissans TaxID=109636 RepID=A0A9P5YQR3_9AGAR|nr:hypothetical protein BDN70DRAFT_886320 [Pholiota conissans]